MHAGQFGTVADLARKVLRSLLSTVVLIISKRAYRGDRNHVIFDHWRYMLDSTLFHIVNNERFRML